MEAVYVLPLFHPDATLENVGGKGMSLARMIASGLPVPGGFHVTTQAYRRFVAENEIQSRISSALLNIDPNNPATFESASNEIADYFYQGKIPAEIEQAVSIAYSTLGNLPVAVRSSATAEDLPAASFAGQQESYLNIRGPQSVLEAVKKCWGSLWTARAIAYRSRNKIDQDAVSLAVVVQVLVPADSSGILFTANPLNGKREEMLINAAWGLGEAVVSGIATPDTLTIKKKTGQVIRKDIAEKILMTSLNEVGTSDIPVPDAKKNKAVLTDAQAAELASLGGKIETLYGMPMDIEWAFTTPRDDHSGFSIVQARPITALPPEWKLPKPDVTYMRASLAEQIPNPVSPLFGTLGLRIFNKATIDLGEFLGIDYLLMEYQYLPINGYVYMGSRMSGKALWNMLSAFLKPSGIRKFFLLFGHAIQRWHDARQKMQETLARWDAKDVSTMAPSELLEGVDQIISQLGRLYTVLQTGSIPLSTISEVYLNFLYKFIKQKGDPEATVFLFGFDTIPVLAEKSLYDLTNRIESFPALSFYVKNFSSAELAAALEKETPPAGISTQNWAELKDRFQAYLLDYGRAAYELDFANPTPAEIPTLILDTIKMYLDGQGQDPYERQRQAIERREQVTQKIITRLHWPLKGWFTKALKWAQEIGPAREDSLMDLGMANPQVRKMLGELGKRFVAGGALENVGDIYWLEESEVITLSALLEKGERLPDLQDCIPRRKSAWQAQLKLLPPGLLPEKSGWGKFIPWHKTDDGGNVLKGYGASSGKITAPACVLLSPDDFSKMKPGSVLVAVTTTPAWTPLFSMASAIVTDIGGPLSHSSIVAREYGIPAVLATGYGTRRIKDEQLLTVDGNAGTVTLM